MITIPTPERHALVWGARGFIGGHLVADLLERGWRVRVLSRASADDRPAWASAVDWIEFDPANPSAAFDAATDGVGTVFNLAGSSGAVASNKAPLESLDSNCRLQLEFLGACERRGTMPHVIFASSRLVYAHAGREPVTEAHPLGPCSMYAAHKLCVEHYHRIHAQREAITFTICRISNPYGLDVSAPGKGYGFVNALIQRAIDGQALTLFGSGAQLRDYLYIADLTRALRLCAERREAMNEVFNVALGTSLPMREAAALIQQAFGGGAIEYRPWPREYEAVESGDFVADTTRLRALLGFVPAHTFASGLDEVCRQVARLQDGARMRRRRTIDTAPAFGADTIAIQG